MSYSSDVGEFHEQLGLPHLGDPVSPHLLSDEAFRYRIACIDEELRELIEAHAKGDLSQFADALGDLVWFVLGTAQLAHIPFHDVWHEIWKANMKKRRWVEGDPVKPRNGTSLEVVKPPGWKPPNIKAILEDRIRVIRRMKDHEND